MGQVLLISLPLICGLLVNMLGYCETSIYPGLRRKPLQQNLQPFEMSSDFLAQLMEENARRRLQQQFEQQVELINMQMNRQRQRQQQRERERYRQLQAMEESEEDYGNGNANGNGNQYDQYDNPNVEFSYKYGPSELGADELGERIPFAVGPSDPRFYEEDARADPDPEPSLDPQALDEYEEYVPAESRPAAAQASAGPEAAPVPERAAVLAPAQAPAEAPKLLDGASTATFHRIKPQSAAAAAVAGVSVAPMKAAHSEPAAEGDGRHDISALIAKLQKEGQAGAGAHEAAVHGPDAHVVMRQHLGMEGEMGMYVVALIAGVSAAITVGLIALGIAWYTLHNKAKAAADVEYPAYGVTGPNKDISPSGDRKLAQSAQMYHYQHQKQQIIAMESRQAAEGHCGLSDVESDDDNEEGDYTVYECPGLAPTGEMEVKNPLFLDETPVTPAAASAPADATSSSSATNMTQATPQQPQAVRKSTGKAPTSTASGSEENARSSKKNKK